MVESDIKIVAAEKAIDTGQTIIYIVFFVLAAIALIGGTIIDLAGLL